MPRAGDRARSTYRLQLSGRFTFDDAAAQADYLARLGVSCAYLSPVLQAAAGSTHGYDVTDHTRVNAELGGEAGYERLCRRLQEAGLEQLLDIVPNHMCVSPGANALWEDVLRSGQASPYAQWFDIDWSPPTPGLEHKVLLPVLGDHYANVLAGGRLKLTRQNGHVVLRYYDKQFPISREVETEILRSRDPKREVAKVNRDPARLDSLLRRQHYRLAHWRAAGKIINYRRFFSVETLAGIRAERPEVFEASHRLALTWRRAGKLAGLRVDHIDGLLNPREYLARLRREAGPDAWLLVEKILHPSESLPRDWPVDGTTGYDFMTAVGGLFVDPAGERGLAQTYRDFTGERGDFATAVRAAKRQVLQESFAAEIELLGHLLGKTAVARGLDLGPGELRRAVVEFVAAMPVYRTYAEADRAASPRQADADRLARTIASARAAAPDVDDNAWTLMASAHSSRANPPEAARLAMRLQQLTGAAAAKGVEDTVFYRHLRLTSLNEVGGDPGRFGTSLEEFHRYCRRVAADWPATLNATSTHDAKRGEDTRLRISLLSEMPGQWRRALTRWSAMNRIAASPKRGVRGMGVSPMCSTGVPPVSERVTARTGACVAGISLRRTVGLPASSSSSAECLLYQALVGAWPISRERLAEYMLKAVREAKLQTSWNVPDIKYERQLVAFVGRVLRNKKFVSDLERFLGPLEIPAWVASMSQTLIKCTAPGAPDFYQGSELWEHTLVDPDNRRPVDFAARRRLLDELQTRATEEVWPPELRQAWARRRRVEWHRLPSNLAKSIKLGLPKMFVIHLALAARRRCAEAFAPGAGYAPIRAKGAMAEHLVCFLRGRNAVTLAPRLTYRLAGRWRDTTIRLPRGKWRDVFTAATWRGGVVRVGSVLKRFPVALLMREGGQ